ncbi:MAG: lipoyl(octanoyl) transferase LipB [Planctomycetes bacterium]|nr:lipoyl(octanoyl) transferase LipB [Planctomycetota bacterium]
MALMPYQASLQLQNELLELRQSRRIADTILLLEHPPVITLGARQSANKLLADETELARKNIELISIRRGGGTTAHNPGQVVIYPIIDLKSAKIGIGEYIRLLEKIGIEFLSRFDVQSRRRKGFPGLWVEDRKIASIGVKIKKWVTFHGMAVNVNNDLSIFDMIVPCGLGDVTMTSVLAETGRNIEMAEAKNELKKILAKYFSG